MGNLRFPGWEKPLREAQSATDLDRMLEKVHETEAAMFVRCLELASTADGNVEREAMRIASDELLKIKIEKLKWPDISAA